MAIVTQQKNLSTCKIRDNGYAVGGFNKNKALGLKLSCVNSCQSSRAYQTSEYLVQVC